MEQRVRASTQQLVELQAQATSLTEEVVAQVCALFEAGTPVPL
jgi:hypothetical protein